jgi:hypothetical protein
MAHRNIVLTGGILRHAVSVILRCWTRVARAAGIAGLIGFVITEIAASVLTQRFPAAGAAHLVALALGAALAYAAGITVFANELIRGTTDAVRLLMGEAEAGAHAAAIRVEREAGKASIGLAPLLRPARLTPAVPGPRAGEASHAPASAAARRVRRNADDGRGAEDLAPASDVARRAQRPGDAATGETLAALASKTRHEAKPETEAVTEPLPPIIGRPVPADRLPRIGWLVDKPDGQVDTATTAAHAAPPQTPAPITRPLSPETSPAPSVPAPDAFGAAAELAAAGLAAEAATPGLAEPQVWHAEDTSLPTPATWHDPLQGAEEGEEESGIRPVDAFGGGLPSAAVTQPLSKRTPPLSEDVSPLAREAQPSSPRGSVWDHISQVLAGKPVEPLPEEYAEDSPADAAPAESEPASE